MTVHAAPRGEAGFTLLEVMISLGLFALIAVAGVALVDGIINVQGRTEARLTRLGELQRTAYVVTSDLDQIAPGRISGGGNAIQFTRSAPGIGGIAVDTRYLRSGDALVRTIGPQPQVLLTGVEGVRWRFFDGAWRDRWPIDPAQPDRWPSAVAFEMRVAGGQGQGGTLRRVVVLPARSAKP